MASACVNSTFIDYPPSDFPAYGWLSSRVSISSQYAKDHAEKKEACEPEESDPAKDFVDFEFQLDDPVKILPTPCAEDDPNASSPKAPRSSSRWREFLGLRKSKQEATTTSSSTKTTGNTIRQFLHRTSKSMSAFTSSDASLRLPLLKDSPSRFSLSSSSSSHDHDEFPRFSLDCDNRPSRSRLSTNQILNPRVRMVKPRMVPICVAENPKPLIDHPSAPMPSDPVAATRRVSMDSPRMISSGKIVFESLERSCSSPSSINGGPRYRNRVERSYSANVRITPVLNVPICSKSGVLGFGQLFSSQSKKKECNSNYHQMQQQQHYSSRVR